MAVFDPRGVVAARGRSARLGAKVALPSSAGGALMPRNAFGMRDLVAVVIDHPLGTLSDA